MAAIDALVSQGGALVDTLATHVDQGNVNPLAASALLTQVAAVYALIVTVAGQQSDTVPPAPTGATGDYGSGT